MGWLSKLFKRKEKLVIVEEPVHDVNEDYEVVALLESFNVEKSELEIKKIESLAEGLETYFASMIKDVSKVGTFKDESQLAFVFTKLKRMVQNALELRNLLEQLVDFYHAPLLDILIQVNEKKNVGSFLKEINFLFKELPISSL